MRIHSGSFLTYALSSISSNAPYGTKADMGNLQKLVEKNSQAGNYTHTQKPERLKCNGINTRVASSSLIYFMFTKVSPEIKQHLLIVPVINKLSTRFL